MVLFLSITLSTENFSHRKCCVDCLNIKQFSLEKVTQNKAIIQEKDSLIKSFKGLPNKKNAKETSHKPRKTLYNFKWAQCFLHSTVTEFYVFGPSFYILFNMTFWIKNYPFRSSHQKVFFKTSALKIWARRLKVNSEWFFLSNVKEFICNFSKNELLCIYMSGSFFLWSFI